MLKLFRVVLLCSIASMLFSCATVSKQEKLRQQKREQKLVKHGNERFEEIKKKKPLSDDLLNNQYVACIADLMIAYLPQPWNEMSWDVTLFDTKKINAFALPGNNIGIYRGMIEQAENPHQLAAVIGHELAHVIAGHSAAQMTTWGMISYGISVAKIQGGEAAAKSVEESANLLIALPHSRTHENEADLLGQEYMARAGFDPQQSIVLWKLMEQKSKGEEIAEILSTHPADKKRIASLQKNLPRVQKLFVKAQSKGLQPTCSRPPFNS